MQNITQHAIPIIGICIGLAVGLSMYLRKKGIKYKPLGLLLLFLLLASTFFLGAQAAYIFH